MRKNKTPFAAKEHDLAGYAAINFYPKNDFLTFASGIAGFNISRHKPVALRMYSQKGEPVFTLYAIDLLKQEDKSLPKGKVAVKKFKLSMSFDEFMSKIKSFDFTVTDGEFDIKDILVVKK